MDWHAEFMKPNDGPSFEHLMVMVCSQIYGTSFSLFGRSGQKQHGIDLYTSGFSICVQCKNYKNSSALQAEMEKDFTTAVQHFGPKLKRYILATTLNRDKDIQEYAEKLLYELPEKQRERLTFELLFWEQIYACLVEHPEFVPKRAGIVSDYERFLPNMEADLWWMGTAAEAPSFTNPFEKLPVQPFWVKKTEEADDDQSNQEAFLQEYQSSIQWLDNCRPIQAGPLLICTQGQGIFFLVSNWTYGFTDSLNRYTSALFDDASDPVYGWVEIRPQESDLLTSDHSGTVIAVKDGQIDIDSMIRCVKIWDSLNRKGQLIFHFFSAINSVHQWKNLVDRAKVCIQQLRSRFTALPISLLSAYNPLRDPLLLNSATSVQLPPEGERAADWMRRNPDMIADAICAAISSPDNIALLLPALSAWPSILEKLFGCMAPDYAQILIESLALDYQMVAVALYHLYLSDPQWEEALTTCLRFCSVTDEQTVIHLMDPYQPLPADTDPIFYGMLTHQHPQNRTPLPSTGGRLMQILNDPADFRTIARDPVSRPLLNQIGKIILPCTDPCSDETTENYRNIIRPYS